MQKNNAFRFLQSKKHPCYAPFLSINFDVTGKMTVCCYNREAVIGRYPRDTILNAWYGQKMQQLRKDLQNLDFSRAGCDLCVKQLVKDNYSGSLLSKFDGYEKAVGITRPLPSIMEFEITNTCNYECIMCGGKWSSSIRKNREKLPPIISPYDDKFVDQLDLFIPNLKFMNFLGGEPFANPLYYKIWDKVITKNPNIKISVTTNGSVLTPKIKQYLQHKNFQIVCSLDSLNPVTYNFIRKNGKFENVMENIEVFLQTKSLVCIAFCPMIQNWQEIPEMLEFCSKKHLSLTFNYVYEHLGGKISGIHENETQKHHAHDFIDNPIVTNTLDIKIPEVSLYTLSKEKKKEICIYLEQKCKPYPWYSQQVSALIKSLMHEND